MGALQGTAEPEHDPRDRRLPVPLKRERETICERAETINGSLRTIDDQPNRYIAMEVAPGQDADSRDFRQDLRTCTEGRRLDSPTRRTETTFSRVRRIIERFRRREGSAEMEKRWSRKITGVRN
jgi:uncharacterized protein YPO0396